MRKTSAALALVALVAVACGQYSGVHQAAVDSGELTTSLGGQPAGTAAGDTGLAGTTTGTTGTGTTGTSGTGTTGTGTTGSQDPSEQNVPGHTTTGVTPKKIKIGIHAPLTGAAPIAPVSFRDGKDLYWDHGSGGKQVVIHGRTVDVVFRNDKYNPQHAVEVCREMVEDEKVFLLVGGGGTDQVQACANYAAQAGVPYLSAGVTEVGMNLGNYFALSMSYRQQVPIVANLIKQRFKPAGNRIAMVVTDTPYFDDAAQEFQRHFRNARVFRHGKNEDGASMAQNLCTGPSKNFDVVFPLVAPLFYLEMAKAAKCNPQYVGVGVTMGLDTVALNGCRADGSTANAMFLSPAPAYVDSNTYDPQFRKAGSAEKDDIMFLLWGVSKTLHQLFDKVGKDLSRERFVASSQEATVKTGIYPDLKYSPNDHFGADQAHLLRNICDGNDGYYDTFREWVTTGTKF